MCPRGRLAERMQSENRRNVRAQLSDTLCRLVLLGRIPYCNQSVPSNHLSAHGNRSQHRYNLTDPVLADRYLLDRVIARLSLHCLRNFQHQLPCSHLSRSNHCLDCMSPLHKLSALWRPPDRHNAQGRRLRTRSLPERLAKIRVHKESERQRRQWARSTLEPLHHRRFVPY